MPSIHIIYGSTGGHAERIAKDIMAALARHPASASVVVERQAAWLATASDLQRGDVLVLVSPDAGGARHLNGDMHALLFDRSRQLYLYGKRVACVALAETRETAEAVAGIMRGFVTRHGAVPFVPPLVLSGRDMAAYDKAVMRWADLLLNHVLHGLRPAHLRSSPSAFFLPPR